MLLPSPPLQQPTGCSKVPSSLPLLFSSFSFSFFFSLRNKDGLGGLGVVVAASRFGRAMDGRPKTARWLSEWAMVAGTSLELASPLVLPGLFLPLAALANACKGLAALSGGASKAAFHRHFARAANLADVTAVSHSQHTAAFTGGTLAGVALSLVLGPAAGAPVWIAFVALSTVQLVAVHRATRVLAMRTLDAGRGPLLAVEFLKSGVVVGPKEMGKREQFAWPFAREKLPFRLEMGASPSVFENEQQLEEAMKRAGNRPFLVHWQNPRLSVVLRPGLRDGQMVEAMFEACRQVVGGEAQFAEFEKALLAAGWTMEEAALETSFEQIRLEWPQTK